MKQEPGEGGAAPRRPSGPASGREQGRRAHIEIVRRRRTLIAAGGLLAAVVVVALLFTLLDSDDEREGSEPGSSVEQRLRRNLLVAPVAGIQIVRPRGWRAGRTARSLRLRSPDRTAAVTVSAPPGARSTRAVFDDAVAVLRNAYRDVRFRPSPRADLAGLPARTAVLTGVNRRGTRFQSVVQVAKGRRRIYLAQVVSSGEARSLVQAQAALNTLRLTK